MEFINRIYTWRIQARSATRAIAQILALGSNGFLPNFAQWSFAISAPFLSISLVVHSVPPTLTAMPCSLAVMTFAVQKADRTSEANFAMKVRTIVDFPVRASC